jgi:hypothetical protein
LLPLARASLAHFITLPEEKSQVPLVFGEQHINGIFEIQIVQVMENWKRALGSAS